MSLGRLWEIKEHGMRQWGLKLTGLEFWFNIRIITHRWITFRMTLQFQQFLKRRHWLRQNCLKQVTRNEMFHGVVQISSAWRAHKLIQSSTYLVQILEISNNSFLEKIRSCTLFNISFNNSIVLRFFSDTPYIITLQCNVSSKWIYHKKNYSWN